MTSSPPSISSSQYTVLSFDLYGTLVDWERGIYPYLIPLLASDDLPASHPYRSAFPTSPDPGADLAPEHPLIAAFSANEARIQDASPRIKFEDVLRGSYEAIAQETGAAVEAKHVEALIQSSREWPAFPDTVAAMKSLQKSGRYKFVALSNNSRNGLKAVLSGPLKDVEFDLAYSAEEIGSYKPDRRNFEYMLKGIEGFGAGKANLLHCAHGVGSDQKICEEMGIRHVWVERKVNNWRKIEKRGMQRLAVVKDAEDLARQMLGM